jgi:dihydrofolate reductase
MQTSQHGAGPATASDLGGGPALAIIAAVAANSVIGVDNRLPWHLPEDLKRFRSLTTGHAVIMGRRTWDSLGRPLPFRQNIVVTRQPDYRAPGAEVAASLDGALAIVRLPGPAYCIGGSALYQDALPRASRLYLTEILREFAGDSTFPSYDPSAWRETSRESHVHGGPGGFEYAFVTYERPSD